MPFSTRDAERHAKGLTPSEQQTWAKVANETRRKALSEGKSEQEADAMAVKAANKAVKNKQEAVSFVEYFDSRDVSLRVDTERHVIQGVKILGLVSKNGREYSQNAIKRAATMYEGAKVNVDHPQGDARQPRSYRDRLGSLKNVSVRDDGLYGDLQYNPRHAVAEQLAWDAQHDPQSVGLSHNITGMTSRKHGKVVVEDIQKVLSVDVVADPATTNGLFEHEEPLEESEMDMSTLTMDQIKASRPDLLQSIQEQTLAAHEASEETKARQDELKTLREENDRLKAEKEVAAKHEAIEKELAEAKLPAELVSDVFRQQLMEHDAAGRKALIEDRQAIAKGWRSSSPKSREQQQVTEGVQRGYSNAQEFARLITN